jgi:hypothetical protein
LLAKVDHEPPTSYANVVGASRDPLNDNTPTFIFGGSDNETVPADLLFSYKVEDGTWSDYAGDTGVKLGGGVWPL